MFSPACFPWQLCFISNTYSTYLTLPLEISQMSTNASQVPNMTCFHLAFCLALSFPIALFFSLDVSQARIMQLLQFFVMSLHAFGYLPLPCWRMSGNCTGLAVLMKPFPCVWCPLSAGILFLSASLRKLTWISKLAKIHPCGLTRRSAELEAMFGQSTSNAS